jgi:hypothetical protein
MRPEIARPLSQAENLWRLGEPTAARESLKAAEAVPDQTADEKQRVATVEALVIPNDNSQSSNFPRRGPIQDSLAEQENSVLMNTPAYTGGPPPPPLQAPPPNPH